MRVYLATKFEEGPRVKAVAMALEAAGHTITYKWWFNDEFTTEQASKDMAGVMTANALVFIAEKDLPYKGAFVELGMAIARNLPVYIMGNAIDACIFVKLPNIHRGIEPLLVK